MIIWAYFVFRYTETTQKLHRNCTETIILPKLPLSEVLIQKGLEINFGIRVNFDNLLSAFYTILSKSPAKLTG
jgi:hypothetical protein